MRIVLHWLWDAVAILIAAVLYSAAALCLAWAVIAAWEKLFG